MTAPKRRWFRFSLRTLFVVVTVMLIATTTFVGLRHSDWTMIQRATRLQALQNASNVEMTFGPSWLWAVVRFRIPTEDVAEFVDKNHCDRSDRTDFKRYRKSLPRESQTLPISGERFYKSGDTTSGKPYELLVGSSGVVIVYVMLDD